MNKMYSLDELNELEAFLLEQGNLDQLREDLFNEFIKFADYRNAKEWNKAVRLCESLAIIGWGNHEPLEAFRGQFFNGNPMTYFINRFGKQRFVDAIWSKRKNGLTMEAGQTSFHYSPEDNNNQTILWNYPVKEDVQDEKLSKQRNWIPKNPIWIMRVISNCYENSREVIESVEKDLQAELDQRMQPEKYGNEVSRIVLCCSFSYFDHPNCKENKIISKSDKRLTHKKAWDELQKMFSKEKIEENGYFLRNRYELGPFRKDAGQIKITINFEKEFSELSHSDQIEKLCEYFLTALDKTVEKLKKKKLGYDFDLMMEDFRLILLDWKLKTTPNTV